MTEDVSDEELMGRIAEADASALHVLMRRHMPRALALAERVVGGNSDADDVCQDAFIRVWTHAANFDPGRAKFTTWFYRIAVNLAIDRTRRQSKQRPLETAGDPVSDQKDALTALIEQDQDRVLILALEALPPRQKAAIALFHVDGLSGREAASAMALSEKAFESLLVRARRSLKDKVAKLEGAAA